MRCSNQGRFRQQVRVLQRQFLQDGDLPFSNMLSESIVAQALQSLVSVHRSQSSLGIAGL